jgi:hypothetical protein
MNIKKVLLIAGAGIFAFGVVSTLAASSQTKSTEKLKGAIAATAQHDTGNIEAEAAPVTTGAETLTDKLDRFFDQEPELVGFDAATRTCAEKNLSGVVTGYEMDALLGADHSDPDYQTFVAGAKMTASGCQLQNN